jgi:hypothetical protein
MPRPHRRKKWDARHRGNVSAQIFERHGLVAIVRGRRLPSGQEREGASGVLAVVLENPEYVATVETRGQGQRVTHGPFRQEVVEEPLHGSRTWPVDMCRLQRERRRKCKTCPARIVCERPGAGIEKQRSARSLVVPQLQRTAHRRLPRGSPLVGSGPRLEEEMSSRAPSASSTRRRVTSVGVPVPLSILASEGTLIPQIPASST